MHRFFLKPVIILSIIATLGLATSCNKDKDINENDLIGTWDIGQATLDVKVGAISLFQFLRTALQLSEQEAQDYVDQLVEEYDYISGGTITFNADYSYQINNGDFEEHGTWELEGDKLYLTVSGEVPDYNPLIIESLSSSSGLISWEEDHEVDVDEDGSDDFTATLVVEVNITKQ